MMYPTFGMTSYDKSGNQVIRSSHKTFNRQTNCICHGNVWAPTMTGQHVRCKQQTECNGFENPEGHLRDFDLNMFREHNMSPTIRQIILEATDNKNPKGVWVYHIFHWIRQPYGHKKRISHGWVITTYEHDSIAIHITPNVKCQDVIEHCLPFLLRKKELAPTR